MFKLGPAIFGAIAELCTHYKAKYRTVLSSLKYCNEGKYHDLSNWKSKRFRVDLSYLLICGGQRPLRKVDRSIRPTEYVVNLLKSYKHICDLSVANPLLKSNKIDIEKAKKAIEENPDQCPSEFKMIIDAEMILMEREKKIIEEKSKIRAKDKRAIQNKMKELKSVRSVMTESASVVGDEFVVYKNKAEIYPKLFECVIKNNVFFEKPKTSYAEVVKTVSIDLLEGHFDFKEQAEKVKDKLFREHGAKKRQKVRKSLLNAVVKEEINKVLKDKEKAKRGLKELKDSWYVDVKKRNKRKPEFQSKELTDKMAKDYERENILPLVNRFNVLSIMQEELEPEPIKPPNFEIEPNETMSRLASNLYSFDKKKKSLRKSLKTGIIKERDGFYLKGYVLNKDVLDKNLSKRDKMKAIKCLSLWPKKSEKSKESEIQIRGMFSKNSSQYMDRALNRREKRCKKNINKYKKLFGDKKAGLIMEVKKSVSEMKKMLYIDDEFKMSRPLCERLGNFTKKMMIYILKLLPEESNKLQDLKLVESEKYESLAQYFQSYYNSVLSRNPRIVEL